MRSLQKLTLMYPANSGTCGPSSLRRGSLPPREATGRARRHGLPMGFVTLEKIFFATDTNLKVAYIRAQSPANYPLTTAKANAWVEKARRSFLGGAGKRWRSRRRLSLAAWSR